jgi:hypothetical protein
MNTNAQQLLELKQYIDDTVANLNIIEEKKEGLNESDRSQLIMECYANIADLEDECKCLRREMRKKLNITDTQYKAWRVEQDALDAQED